MADAPYDLRYMANRLFYDSDRKFDMYVPFQSNLEKAGRAMRYAMKTVQYYSPNYNYETVSKERNNEITTLFHSGKLR